MKVSRKGCLLNCLLVKSVSYAIVIIWFYYLAGFLSMSRLATGSKHYFTRAKKYDITIYNYKFNFRYMRLLNNTLLILSILVLGFGFTINPAPNVSADQGGLVIKLSVTQFSQNTTDPLNPVQDFKLQNFDYDCVNGPTSIQGVDVSLIKQQCQQARSTWQYPGQVYADYVYYDAYYGKNQVNYGFWTGGEDNLFMNFHNGSLNSATFIEYEPNFNRVFVDTGSYDCAGINSSSENCTSYTPTNGSDDWAAYECGNGPIETFTQAETDAICRNSIQNGNYFSYKARTVNRNRIDLQFTATWNGTSWQSLDGSSNVDWVNI